MSYEAAAKAVESSSIGREARAGVSASRRLANAMTILREFRKAGMPVSWALAAIVNSDAESGLNDQATSGSGKSHGLFQLHDSGLGAGIPISQRMDPAFATRKIIEEVNRVKRFTKGTELSTNQAVTRDSMVTTYDNNGSIADLAGAFCFFVERPYELRRDTEARKQKARDMFPSVANQPARAFDQGIIRGEDTVIEGVVPKGEFNWPVIMVGGAFMLFTSVAIWWNWQRSSMHPRRSMWWK